jgi:hypothetical protein
MRYQVYVGNTLYLETANRAEALVLTCRHLNAGRKARFIAVIKKAA